MERKQKFFVVLSSASFLLAGCGPNLTGNYVGTLTKSGTISQSYQANLSLNQNGDRVSGNVVGNPSSSTAGSMGGFSLGPATGQFEATLSNDILTSVKVTMNEGGCQTVYKGNLNILNGVRLNGILISEPPPAPPAPTAENPNPAPTVNSSCLNNGGFGVFGGNTSSSATFDVSK